jgi:capsule biosynthesis phosphatase
MRICIDLDGTIAKNKTGEQTYEDVEPMQNAVEVLNELKANGCYIIIHTARNMGTCNNNLGSVIARQANLVTNWLKKYNIPYDELLFGKPNVDYFIDDKGIGFENWTKTKSFLMEKITDV